MSIDYFLGSPFGVDLESSSSGDGTSAFSLVSATSLDPGVVRLVFSEAVLSDTSQQTILTLPIFDPHNFVITEQVDSVPIYRARETLRVLRVKKINDTTFDLITEEQTNTWYNVEAFNIYDNYGNPIADTANSMPFFGSRHPYILLANEMHIFPTSYMGADAFEVTDFIPDQSLPILQNQIPAPGDIDIIQTTPIQLEIVDYGEGINPDTTTLTVDGNIALLGGQAQSGYAVTQTVIPNGYHYLIQPSEQLYEGSIVDIGVYAEDLSHLPMVLSTSYSFSTTGTGPVIENRDPEDGATLVSPKKTILFDLVDPHSNIDVSSVLIRVNGIAAIVNDIAQTDFTFDRTAISGGYTYAIRFDGHYPDGITAVLIAADNAAEVPLSVSETHYFTVDSSAIPPTLAPIGHRLNVTKIDLVLEQQPKTVWNQYDEHGLTLSLNRLEGETNWEYKRRLMDTMVHTANSSYQGMVHGITRELGLALSQPVIINPKTDADGRFLAPDPYIRFEGAYLYLYSDYASDRLDWAIDRYEAGGNYEHMVRMVDFINTTAFFEASIFPGFDHYARSMTLINQSNRVLVLGEPVQASTRFKLDHGHLVRHSMTFNDRSTFKTEVSSVDLVNAAGKFHIDYHNGIVSVGSIPEHELSVRYKYTEYPFKPIASPVIVCDITNDNFRAKMFRQVQLDNGTYAHGLPREVGVDIINELLSVVPMYWGL